MQQCSEQQQLQLSGPRDEWPWLINRARAGQEQLRNSVHASFVEVRREVASCNVEKHLQQKLNLARLSQTSMSTVCAHTWLPANTNLRVGVERCGQ